MYGKKIMNHLKLSGSMWKASEARGFTTMFINFSCEELFNQKTYSNR